MMEPEFDGRLNGAGAQRDSHEGWEGWERWRRLAVHLLRGERANHTLCPTELVHEAWLRLSCGEGDAKNGHGDRVAARAMRNALVDHARARRADKRDAERTSALECDPPADAETRGFDAFRIAFERLERMDPDLVRLLRLRFEEELTVEATAAALGVSPRTIKRETRAARAWLRQALTELYA